MYAGPNNNKIMSFEKKETRRESGKNNIARTKEQKNKFFPLTGLPCLNLSTTDGKKEVVMAIPAISTGWMSL